MRVALRTHAATESVNGLGAWLVGFILTSSGLLLLAFVSPFEIDVNWGLLVLVAVACLASAGIRAGWTRLSLGRLEILALLLVAAAAGLWSQENIVAIAVGADAVVAHPWVDAFVHATNVGLFAHGATHLSNPWSAGQPANLYHYGGYMVASLLCRLASLDAYTLTVGWYAPAGLLVTGLAARMLGNSLLGSRAGFGAVLIALLLPDPSHYELGNGWTSYFFLQTVGPGGAYAVGALGVAWALFFTYLRSAGRSFLPAALLFGGLTVLFKAQIFLVYTFGLLLLAALFLSRIRWPTRVSLIVGIALALVLAVAMLPRIPNAPTLEIDPSRIDVNIDQVVRSYSSAGGAWARDLWQEAAKPGERFWVAAAIVLVSTYGAWLLALILALAISVKSPLPWAWSGATLFGRLSLARGRGRLLEFGLAAVGIVALVIAHGAGQTVQSGLWWSKNFARLEFPRGLYDAARFVREYTPTGSVVQYSENDGFSVLVALGERKTYLAHSVVSSAPPKPEAERRFQGLMNLLASPTVEVARTNAARLGIDWLLFSPNRQPLWAASLRPGFESQGFRLYYVGPGPDRFPALP